VGVGVVDGRGWILLAGRVRPRLIATGGLLTAFGFAILRHLAESSIYRYECCRSQRMAIAPQIGGR
jgi:hypothetical protein